MGALHMFIKTDLWMIASVYASPFLLIEVTFFNIHTYLRNLLIHLTSILGPSNIEKVLKQQQKVSQDS